MSQIEALTQDQIQQAEQLLEAIFQRVISPHTNKYRAEAAVAVLVQEVLNPDYSVHWVTNPGEGRNLRDAFLLSELKGLQVRYQGSALNTSRHICEMLVPEVSPENAFSWHKIDFESKFGSNIWWELKNTFRPLESRLSLVSNWSGASLFVTGTKSWVQMLFILDIFCKKTLASDAHLRLLSSLQAAIDLVTYAWAVWVMPGRVIICQRPCKFNLKEQQIKSVEFSNKLAFVDKPPSWWKRL